MFRPTALPRGGLLVQLVERADGVAVGRPLVMFFRRGVGAIQDAATLLDGFGARFGERAIRIAAQHQPPQSAMVPLEKHAGFVAAWRDADREPRRERIEDFLPAAVTHQQPVRTRFPQVEDAQLSCPSLDVRPVERVGLHGDNPGRIRELLLRAAPFPRPFQLGGTASSSSSRTT